VIYLSRISRDFSVAPVFTLSNCHHIAYILYIIGFIRAVPASLSHYFLSWERGSERGGRGRERGGRGNNCNTLPSIYLLLWLPQCNLLDSRRTLQSRGRLARNKDNKILDTTFTCFLRKFCTRNVFFSRSKIKTSW
jgi:hypothetical protein